MDDDTASKVGPCCAAYYDEYYTGRLEKWRLHGMLTSITQWGLQLGERA